MNSPDTPGDFLLDESAEELYEQAPCGYLTTTVDGRIAKVNATLLDWLGYQRGHLIGHKRLTDVLTVGGRMYFETHVNLLLRMQSSVDEIALDVVRKDGSVLPTLINARQKRTPSGEPVCNRYTIFNARERRNYERDIVTERDLYRTTLASIGDGVVATDIDGRITSLNGEAARLCGWIEDEARGKPIEDVLVLQSEDNRRPIDNPIRHALRISAVVGLANHTVLVAKDGRVLTVDDSASPIRNANGDIVGCVLVFRDVTERRKTERKLAEAERVTRAMNADLQRSNEDLSQFAAVASHDLRSPLNNVLQFAQLLELRHASDLGQGAHLLTMLIASAKRMAALIEDLLRYALLTSEFSSPSAPVDANAQLAVALQNLEAEIERSGAVITSDVLPVLHIDPTNLSQVFQNLVGNAIHYRTVAPPRIHVGVVDDGDFWRFSCRDNGVGIALKYQEQIFEPFKRLHGNDRPGSGIGLAICKKVMERFGGRIWVESEEGSGSTFSFTLPKAV